MMSRSTVALLVAGALLLGGACGKFRHATGDDASKKDIPIRVQFFESGAIGKSLKPDGSVGEVISTFKPSDHLYVSIKSYFAPTGLAANMQIMRPNDPTPVLESRTEFSPKTMRGVFTVNDLKNWVPGDYHVRVFLQGDAVFEQDIHVVSQ